MTLIDELVKLGVPADVVRYCVLPFVRKPDKTIRRQHRRVLEQLERVKFGTCWRCGCVRPSVCYSENRRIRECGRRSRFRPECRPCEIRERERLENERREEERKQEERRKAQAEWESMQERMKTATVIDIQLSALDFTNRTLTIDCEGIPFEFKLPSNSVVMDGAIISVPLVIDGKPSERFYRLCRPSALVL